MYAITSLLYHGSTRTHLVPENIKLRCTDMLFCNVRATLGLLAGKTYTVWPIKDSVRESNVGLATEIKPLY